MQRKTLASVSVAIFLASICVLFWCRQQDPVNSPSQRSLGDKVVEIETESGKGMVDVGLKFQSQCDVATETDRYDCFPDDYKGLSQETCEKRGCCWNTRAQAGAPCCFYPRNYPSYRVVDSRESPSGLVATLTRDTRSVWPDDVKNLRLEVMFETQQRVHFKIYDVDNRRFEVPLDLPKRTHYNGETDYDVDLENEPFSLTITRKSTGKVVFTSKGVAPLIFADQFIQFGTRLPSRYLYGLGERRGSMLLNLNWTKLTMWASDHAPVPNSNLYGAHPVYLSVEDDEHTSGAFLVNSNAMQVDLQATPALTYRTTGGVLDLYVFLGARPDDVVRQYSDLIGHTHMPPFWSLGFHLCRWGYNTSAGLQKVIARMRASNMPYDTQWGDIDYMDRRLDFTHNPVAFQQLPSIVGDLHEHGQHYIPILDPGISNSQAPGTYPPFDDGIKQGVFIRNDTGPIIGRVWPGTTAYPDFFSTNADNWWYTQLKRYHDQVPYDGVWIDMNEPSNFVTGSLEGCPASRYNNPPFIPLNVFKSLVVKTLCLTAKQAISTHYNLHNLYGFSESRSTARAMEKILNKRSIIITRSSFSSTGRYAGHWTGDNRATWMDLAWSIPAILSFQFFAIPLVGADVCGFSGSTSIELCTRWIQLGAFYPFMRNHNSLGEPDQDPAAFDQVTQNIMRTALQTRYRLLPYLYTLFYRSHINGSVVARPIFFNYPSVETYPIDAQFMWGDALLISPVIKQGATRVSAYMPADTWYDYYSGVGHRGLGQYVILDAPIDKINLHVRGGSVIPTLPPATTTTSMRKNKFGIIVALSTSRDTSGDLYWDDGDEVSAIADQHFTYVTFHSAKGSDSVTSNVLRSGYKGASLGSARILGVATRPTVVTANGGNVSFSFNDTSHTLSLTNMSLALTEPFSIKWTT